MPTLSLGGQTLATQTGSDAPILGSVTLNSNQSFPSGHLVYKGILFEIPPLYSTGVSNYDNNKANLVNSGSLSTTITTTITNSKIWIYGMFTRGDDNSHSNSDI